MTARGHSGDASRSLASKRLFVRLYRFVILAIGVGILVGLASFVVEHVNGGLVTDGSVTIMVPLIAVIMAAYGVLLFRVVGRNWLRYESAVHDGRDPGSFIEVLYPSRWPLL